MLPAVAASRVSVFISPFQITNNNVIARITILFITLSAVTCVVSFSLAGPRGIQKLVLGGVPGNQKMGLGNSFGCVMGLNVLSFLPMRNVMLLIHGMLWQHD